MRVIASFLILYLMGLGIVHAYKVLFDDKARKHTSHYLLLLIPVLLYLYAMAAYLGVDTFRQHVEPSMVIHAQLIAAGQQIYTALDAADRFSLQYGPTTYIFTAFFLKFFDDPILASKVYGIFMSLLGLAILFFTIKKNFSTRIAYMGLVFSTLTYLMLAEISFRNQADSLLLFSVILSIAGLFSKQTIISAFLVSLGIALAVDAKAHTVLYFLPVLYLYYYHHGRNNFFAIIILTPLLAGSVFLLPQFDLINYLIWLTAAAKHGFGLSLFAKNIAISLLFSFPAILLYKINCQAAGNTNNTTTSIQTKAFYVLLLSMLLMSAVASKNGAGIHHILPFTPVIALFIAFFLSDLTKEKLNNIIQTKQKAIIVFLLILAWLFAIGADIVKEQKQYFKFINLQKKSFVYNDIIQLKQKYKHYVMYMGYSAKESYKQTYYRPLIFSAQQGNALDPVALMDMEISHIDIPPATVQKIASQVYDIILIPKGGKPFAMTNGYAPHRPLFGKKIPKTFIANYKFAEQSRYFEVWASNRVFSEIKNTQYK